jgi:hypothetical protein
MACIQQRWKLEGAGAEEAGACGLARPVRARPESAEEMERPGERGWPGVAGSTMVANDMNRRVAVHAPNRRA